MDKYIAAIDQGTTNSRCIIFNHAGDPVGSGQLKHTQIYPQPGWVEHDPMEIWANVQTAVSKAIAAAAITVDQISAIGITNQRETAVVWNKLTGKPYSNAIAWQDTRTDELCKIVGGDGDGSVAGADRYRHQTGLPLATCFSAPKVRWILDNIPHVRKAATRDIALFGTIDSWLIWNLTGGARGGMHVTDVTNASRTLLMDLETLTWSPTITEEMGIPMGMLPDIRPSSQIYGYTTTNTPFGSGIPVAGALGNQQAAMVGQACFDVGNVKSTYGTDCFMLLNTGNEIIRSRNGLLTTVCYQFGEEEAVYAIEGSIAVTNALEATAFQTRKRLDAMRADLDVEIDSMKVDGRMVHNESLMQFQADVLGIPIMRPRVAETMALGAAYAAGLAVGFWKDKESVRQQWQMGKTWQPSPDDYARTTLYTQWKKAVTKTFDWK